MSLQYYSQYFAGMKDIDAIVERFMEAEDANFSLFNYVNEVNAEVEKLEEQIAEIKVQTELPQSQIQCVIIFGSIYNSTFWYNMSVSLPASTSAHSGMSCQNPYQDVLRKCRRLLQKKTENCAGHLNRLLCSPAGKDWTTCTAS